MKERPLQPTTKFLKIVCSKCKNEQVIFNKAATNVKCVVCGAVLAECTGGKSRIKAKVLQVMQ